MDRREAWNGGVHAAESGLKRFWSVFVKFPLVIIASLLLGRCSTLVF